MGLDEIFARADAMRAERGGRSDTIATSVPVGSFVVPAMDVAQIGGGDTKTGGEVLGLVNAAMPEPPNDAPFQQIRISRGEHVLPPAAAAQLGEEGLWALIERLKGGR